MDNIRTLFFETNILMLNEYQKIIQRMKQIGPIHQNRLKFDQSSDLPYILSIKMKESLTKPINKHETL